MKKRVLITGGSGFIGGKLAQTLSDRGFEVRAFYRKGDDDRLLDNRPVEKIEGDINDIPLLTEAAAGCAYVFHTAGNVSFRRTDYDIQYQVNVEGTRSVVQACRHAEVGRLIHTSTVNTLGIPGPEAPVGDENTPFVMQNCPFNYGRTKKMAEDIALAANGPDLEVVSVNPGTVFGPGDINANAGSYILAIAHTPMLFYPEGGTNCVHVDAVISGHIAAMEKGRPGERYILGGENLTYQEIFTLIARLLGRPRPRFKLPTGLAVFAAHWIETLGGRWGFQTKLAAEAARAGQYRFFYSSQKAIDELALPEIPFSLAAEEAIGWYRKEGLLKC